LVSGTASNSNNSVASQQDNNEALALKRVLEPWDKGKYNIEVNIGQQNDIDIQIPYDSNWPMKPKLWNGSLSFISLYRSLKQLLSDVKNIKVLLDRMTKYIQK